MQYKQMKLREEQLHPDRAKQVAKQGREVSQERTREGRERREVSPPFTLKNHFGVWSRGIHRLEQVLAHMQG